MSAADATPATAPSVSLAGGGSLFGDERPRPAADVGVTAGPGVRSRAAKEESTGPGAGRGPPRGAAGRTSNRPAQGNGAGAGDASPEDSTDDDSASTASGGMQQQTDQLYDEAADEKDAVWMDRQRGGRVSDAVLSCPGCFTTLCIDCQRHEQYHQQYRAMFVMNCQVGDEAAGGEDFDPAAPGGAAGGRGGRRPKRAKPSSQYRRVLCEVCSTEVGAFDTGEDLYHFYHVFPSNA